MIKVYVWGGEGKGGREKREGRKEGREEGERRGGGGREESGRILCRAHAVNSMLSVFRLLPWAAVRVRAKCSVYVSGEVGFVCSPA